jgi:tRNA dimethylallyltransferase
VFPLVSVLGPTGSGKSTLAVSLALAFNGEVVNCDSIQLYRHLHIGTAKITDSERRGIPHHLLDVLEPNEVFTAADYARLARSLLNDIQARGRLPILAGGTGFYFRALTQGLFAGPARNEGLRERLMKRSAAFRHRLLRRLDPAAAQRIHPNDINKVLRAVEVCILARKPITSLFEEGNSAPLEKLRQLRILLNPDRAMLANRLNERTRAMFQNGLLDEVRSLLALGYGPETKALESIGYREALQHLAGEISLEQAIELASAATRQYAKRQRTWFRREPDLHVITCFGDSLEALETAKALVAAHLQPR